jgi:hypothetical protein
MDLRRIGCEDGRHIELAQDQVQWWVLVYLIPVKMIGSQNKFSSPPTPFETC